MMNKDKFWEIIEKVRNQCKDNAEKMVDVLGEELGKCLIEDVQRFSSIFNTYHHIAYKEGLFSIGSMMNHYMMTDDGFIDFRYWLISQGKETYMNAMKDPMALCTAEIKPIGDWYEFESFGYVPMTVIEEKTGDYRKAQEDLPEAEEKEILSEIEFGDYIDKTLKETDIKMKYPDFAKRYEMENISYEMKLNGTLGEMSMM